MYIVNTILKYFLKNVIWILLVMFLIQSCKAYQSPITLNQAANSEEKGVVKITMMNGDEYIYENIEVKNNRFYGVKTVNSEKISSELIMTNIQSVQKQNKKLSGFMNFAGIVVVAGSIYLMSVMLGG